MLQADAAEHVRYRQQEVVAAVRARTEDRIGLAHQRAMRLQHRGVGLQRLRILRHHLQPHRLPCAVIQCEPPEMATGEHRRIDQRHQRQRCVVLGVAVTAHQLQRAAALPARRQAQGRLDLDAPRIHSGRIQHHPVPLQIQQIGCHRHPALVGGGRRQVLELDLQHAHALWYLQREGIHVAGITCPLQRLAVAADDQPGHLVDRPGGCMVAGDPLRIPQGQRAGRHRNALAHTLDAPLDITGVHFKFDHARIAGLHLHRHLPRVAARGIVLLCLHPPGRDAQRHHQPPVTSVLHHAPILARSDRILARLQRCRRCHTSSRLLAGIATSSNSRIPCACASASTASKSRMPERASRAFNQPSKARLLSLVKAPP